MGTIVIATNVSLDGVVEDPDGQEGFSRGGWFTQALGPDRDAWAEIEVAEALNAQALLLGRATDAWFASRWLSRSGVWADRLNTMPKYVVSSTLDQVKWGDGTVLRGDPVAEVTTLKQSVDGEIVVYASYQLARTLLDNDLVDELRLFVFPVVVGAGQRLFGGTGEQKSLRLLDTRPIGSGLVLVSYALGVANKAYHRHD